MLRNSTMSEILISATCASSHDRHVPFKGVPAGQSMQLCLQ